MMNACAVCLFPFLYGDVLVATVGDPYADDGPEVIWVHERCAKPSEREVTEE